MTVLLSCDGFTDSVSASIPGRIIARFVSDTRTLDGELTEFTRSVLDTTITLLIKLATIGFVVPVFGIAGLLLGCIGAFVAELYIHAQMSCKRESSNKKSPLFSHFGDAVAGLISVRAYDSEEAMKTEAEKRCDAYVRTGVSFCAFLILSSYNTS